MAHAAAALGVGVGVGTSPPDLRGVGVGTSPPDLRGVAVGTSPPDWADYDASGGAEVDYQPTTPAMNVTPAAVVSSGPEKVGPVR